jgi:hypothetical protein
MVEEIEELSAELEAHPFARTGGGISPQNL